MGTNACWFGCLPGFLVGFGAGPALGQRVGFTVGVGWAESWLSMAGGTAIPGSLRSLVKNTHPSTPPGIGRVWAPQVLYRQGPPRSARKYAQYASLRTPLWQLCKSGVGRLSIRHTNAACVATGVTLKPALANAVSPEAWSPTAHRCVTGPPRADESTTTVTPSVVEHGPGSGRRGRAGERHPGEYCCDECGLSD